MRLGVRPGEGGGRDVADGGGASAMGRPDKKVTGGQVLAGRLPSRSGIVANAEQPCRRSFGH